MTVEIPVVTEENEEYVKKYFLVILIIYKLYFLSFTFIKYISIHYKIFGSRKQRPFLYKSLVAPVQYSNSFFPFLSFVNFAK